MNQTCTAALCAQMERLHVKLCCVPLMQTGFKSSLRNERRSCLMLIPVRHSLDSHYLLTARSVLTPLGQSYLLAGRPARLRSRCCHAVIQMNGCYPVRIQTLDQPRAVTQWMWPGGIKTTDFINNVKLARGHKRASKRGGQPSEK